jgi:hypothetical protein
MTRHHRRHQRQAARLWAQPVTLRQAQAFVARHHRHHGPPQGHKFSIGIAICGNEPNKLVGVVIVGRPIARHLDDGRTAEITRLATDGTPNACSALLATAWRTARAMGYRRLITYTHAAESGASLRAAAYRRIADLPARNGWSCPSRPRRGHGADHTVRTRWQITAGREQQ